MSTLAPLDRLLAVAVILAPVTLAAAQTVPGAPPLGSATPMTGLATNSQPTVIVGDPGVPDFPTAFDAINFNEPDSPLAGVVSVYSAATTSTGFLGSGVALDRYHILTAAHVVDFSGGITPEGAATGDGTVDALMPYSRVYVNNIAAPDPITIDAVQVSSQWQGFRNAIAPNGPSNHGDLAILTLHTPLPASVPVYPIYRTPFETDSGKVILMSGYGGGGNAVDGITQPASFDIKRYGWNVATVYEPGANSSKAENYLSDFDQSDPNGNPDFFHTGFDGVPSLGNDFESIIAPGDSGGAAFIVDDKNGDGLIEADELTLFGLTTFTFDTPDGSWPGFGAGFGGPIVSAYTDFIDGALAVPEPASLLMLAFPIGLAMTSRRRSRRGNAK